jgi:tryptophan synthase beta chain
MKAEYFGINDDEAVQALLDFSSAEGIIPALESSHALALAKKRAENGKIILVNLSGRGDKDLHTVRDYLAKK